MKLGPLSLKPLTEEDIERMIAENIDTSKMKYIYWENAPENKSIPDLWHIQVLSTPKRLGEPTEDDVDDEDKQVDE